MNTKFFLRSFIASVVLVGAILGWPISAQGATTQSIAWTGTSNEILALNTAYPLSAIASSGLPVTIRVKSGPAIVAAGQVTATGFGTIWLIAEQLGNEQYARAEIERMFNFRVARLTPVGQYNSAATNGGVDLQVVGRYAYLANDSAGVEIVDVGDPTRPTLVGHAATRGSALRIQVVGNYAYVGKRAAQEGDIGGLEIFDVTNPSSPTHVGEHSGGRPYGYIAQDLQVVGKYAFVVDAGAQAVRVVDVSVPTNPVQVGNVFGWSDIPLGIAIAGRYGYVAVNMAGLQVLDFNDPTQPQRVTLVTDPGAPAHMAIQGDYLYTLGHDYGLKVWDIRTPSNPTLVGQIGTSGLIPDLDLAGDYAFIQYSSVIKALDISNPPNLMEVGRAPTSGQSIAIRAVGDYVFCANRAVPSGLTSLQTFRLQLRYRNDINFTPPGEIEVITGSYTLPRASSNGTEVNYSVESGPAHIQENILTFNGTGTVRLRASQADDGLYMPIEAEWTINIVRAAQVITWTGIADSIPLNQPLPLTATSSSDLPVTLRVESGPAVIADGKITITAPGKVWVTAEQPGDANYLPASKARAFNWLQAAVSLVGQYADPAPMLDFLVNGNFLYAASGEQGVRIFDLGNPALPRLVGQYPLPPDSRKMSAAKIGVEGNMAVVANNPVADPDTGEILTSSFDVFDITDPTHPVLRGSLSWWDGDVEGNSPLAMQLAGRFAYVSLRDGRLLTIDVSNPAAPALSFENHFNVEGVVAFQLVGSLMYLATSPGLSVWDISAPTGPVQIAQHNLDVSVFKVSGRRIYTLTPRGLVILEGDPTNLVMVGNSSGISLSTGFDVSGDYIFDMRGGFSDMDVTIPSGVEIFDAGNPARVIRVGGYYPATGSRVRVSGDIAYLSGNVGAPLTLLKTTLRAPSEPRLEISRSTPFMSVLSAPSIPGWQVQKAESLEPDQPGWENLHRFSNETFFQESDGIKRFRLNTTLSESFFFRMHRADF